MMHDHLRILLNRFIERFVPSNLEKERAEKCECGELQVSCDEVRGVDVLLRTSNKVNRKEILLFKKKTPYLRFQWSLSLLLLQ